MNTPLAYLGKRLGLKQFNLPKETTAIVLLAIILFVISKLTQSLFFTWANITIILSQASVVAVLACGMTLVMLTGGIDLSVGMVMSLSSSVFGVLILGQGFHTLPSLIIALAAGATVGLLNGFVITKGKIQPFIVTLGMMGIAQGIAQIITANNYLEGLPENFLSFGETNVLGQVPAPVFLMASVYIIMFVLLEFTKLGRNVYTIGGNEHAARLAGINVDLYKILVYSMNGLLAGLAGMIPSARIYTANPSSGSGFELDAIAAAVIGGVSLSGGRGSLLGTLIGALLMSTMKNVLYLLKVSPFILKVTIGGIIIGAALLDHFSKRKFSHS